MHILHKIVGTKNVAASVGEKAHQTTGAIVDGGKSAINTTIQTTGKVAQSAYDQGGKALHTVTDKSSEVLHNVWDGTKNTATSVAEGTKNAASAVVGGTKTAAANVVEETKDLAAAGAEKTGQAWEGSKQIGSDALTILKSISIFRDEKHCLECRRQSATNDRSNCGWWQVCHAHHSRNDQHIGTRCP